MELIHICLGQSIFQKILLLESPDNQNTEIPHWFFNMIFMDLEKSPCMDMYVKCFKFHLLNMSLFWYWFCFLFSFKIVWHNLISPKGQSH